MEAPPPLLPAGRDRSNGHLTEGRAQELLAARVHVGRELEPALALDLLEPRRGERKESSAGDLGLAGRHAERDAPQVAQRSALFRRRKNPSSSSFGA